MTSIAHSKNIEHSSEEIAEMWNEEDNMNAKINMEAVIAEFKERLASEKNASNPCLSVNKESCDLNAKRSTCM